MTMPVPKRLGGGSKLNVSQRRSSVQERETATRLGGRVTKQSGGGIFEKGDVRVKGVIRVECKTTKHSSFRVTDAVIDKIESQALAAGEMPVLEIDLRNGERGVYVVPKWALENLLSQVQLVAEDTNP